MNLANTISASEALETGPHAMRFTYTSGDRPLEGYTIKRGIGHGGFGEVYYAVSDGGKEVALKLVQRNLDVELRGVGQCLNVKHPNLVTLYDVRRDEDGEHWIVMEYMAGSSLDRVIDARPAGLPAEEAIRWLREIAAGVDYLHEHGIVHRDLKPGNLFIEDGQIKIGDYGLAKFITASRRSGHTESVGTVHYMAPELAEGRYSKEIDLYALGVILYEMLTGHVPFDGESVGEILMKHLTAEPDLSRLAEVYRPVVGRLLAKDPAARYPSVGAMLTDLERRTEHVSPAARRSEQAGPHTAATPQAAAAAFAHHTRAAAATFTHQARATAESLAREARAKWRCGPRRACHVNWGPATWPGDPKQAKLVGLGTGLALFGWAVAGGIPEAAPFFAIGGGILAGGLVRCLPSRTLDDAGRRVAGALGFGVGFFAFGSMLAAGMPSGALFIGLGVGLLARAVLPYFGIGQHRIRARPPRSEDTGRLEDPLTVDPGIPQGPSDAMQDQRVQPAAAAVVAEPRLARSHGRPIRTLVKFLVWTLIFGFVFVLFGGLLAVMGVWMLFDPHVTQDPVAVEGMTAGITEITPLEGLVPRFAAGESFLGSKLAVYTDPEHGDEDRFLLLVAFPHGHTNLPGSVQGWLEEELAVVRPRQGRMAHEIHFRERQAPSGSRLLPPPPPQPLPVPEFCVHLPGADPSKIRSLFPHARVEAAEGGSVSLLDEVAGWDDTQQTYTIRGKEQVATIRRGREHGHDVVRAFAPFEAKGGKPALLVFGTPAERWDAGDAAKFAAMLESMN